MNSLLWRGCGEASRDPRIEDPYHDVAGLGQLALVDGRPLKEPVRLAMPRELAEDLPKSMLLVVREDRVLAELTKIVGHAGSIRCHRR